MSERLLPVHKEADILAAYHATPVADLLAYQNLWKRSKAYTRAELVIGMCMDHRNILRIPDNFAYILRAGGANLRRIEFKLAYAVAVGGVRMLALIGHDQCGMVGLTQKREEFVRGLVEHGGWTPEAAKDYFDQNAPIFEITDAAEFIRSEAERLRGRFPRLTVAPLMYSVTEGVLYQIAEDAEP